MVNKILTFTKINFQFNIYHTFESLRILKIGFRRQRFYNKKYSYEIKHKGISKATFPRIPWETRPRVCPNAHSEKSNSEWKYAIQIRICAEF